MLESYKPILSSPEQTTTQAQTTAPGSSFTGGTNLFWKPEEDEPVNKNGTLGILGRTAALLPQSIGKGLTNQLDKISDTPTNIRNWMAQKDEEVLNDWASKEAAKKSWYDYRQKADTHLLGQGVKDWEQRVDEKQQAIVNDNPTSKLAQAGAYANELGESVGAMIPTIAASAVTGGLMAAANGGSAALGARAALGSKKALDALETIKGVSEAAGLGTMFMGVYSNSLEDAVNNGADYQAAAKKALLDGLLEVGTEKMFAGIAGLGEGVFASTARKVVNSTGADDAVKMLGVKKAGLAFANMINRVSEMSKSSPVANLLFDALGEGAEEMVSEFFSPYIERATTNKYAENATLEEILRAGLGGALISFAMNPVGKITGKLTNPSEDRMAQERMKFRTTDSDQFLASMATLSFQEVTSKEDIDVIENILDRKLQITPVMDAGEVTGYYAEGLSTKARRRAAVEAMQEYIDTGRTLSGRQLCREKMQSIWDEEVQERQDNAGALAFADKMSAERLNNSKEYQDLVKKVEELEPKYTEAKAKHEELEKTAKEEGATEETKKAAEEANRVYLEAKNELTSAKRKMETERKRLRFDMDYNITEQQFREEFGNEFMDSFFAAQRVKQAREGQAYLEGSDGLKRVYNKYDYAKDRYNDEYANVKEKVDADFKKFNDDIVAEINTYKDKVNEALASRGIKPEVLRVEISEGPSKHPAEYYNGVITFDATQLSSAMGAQFLLSHELLHAIDDRFMTNEQFDALGKAIEKSMEALNFDAENTYRILAPAYEDDYLPAAIKEAESKGIPEEEVLEYADEIVKRRIKEETYARFMSVAFGSDSILQSLAMVNPALLQRMKESVESSSLANLPNSVWGYTRWQVLDRINKALTAPVDPEDLKDDLEIDKEMAFARLSDQHNPDVVDHMYARSAEALSVMSDKSFRSAISNPDLFLRKYLRKYGVTDEEIKQTGLVPEAQALWERVQKGELTDAEARQQLIERAETEGILEEIVKPNTKREKSVWTDKTLMGDSDKYADYLYTLPTDHPGANFASEHWDEPGVLVHARADRRYTTNGESVFFVEENQSDYHNQAHKKDSKTKQRLGSYNDDAPALLEEVQAKLDDPDSLSDDEYKAIREEERRLISAVPHAYYENDFAEEYAMKRMLLHAIENGDDFLAWTTPKMQENRWSEEYSKAYRNTYGLRIPGFMDRYVRQWGSKVEPISLSVSYRGVPAESYGLMSSIMPGEVMPTDPDISENNTYEVYGVRITPEMRKAIMENGQNRWNFTRLGDNVPEIDAERLKEYQALMEKYGAYDNGTLRKIAQHVGVNQTVDQILGSKNVGSKTLNTRLINAVLEGEEGLTHIIMTDDAAKMDALKRIRSHQTLGEAYTEATNALNGKKLPDKNDIVFGEQLLVDMAKQLQNIELGQDVRENESKDPTELLNQMQHLIADLCAAGTRAGQNLQAFRLLKKLTPTGRLYYIEAQTKAYLSEMVDRKGLSRVGGYRYLKDKKGNVIIDERTGKPKEALKISDALRQKMEACKTQEEMDAVEAEIIDEIASQIPPTLTDRIVAWRYLAMLGNPRTHIRNMVSNYAMGVAVKAKDKVGGVLEDIFLKDRDSVGRTKTNKRIDSELRKSLEEFADNDWTQDNVNEYALSGGKVGFQSKIDERRNKLGLGNFTLIDDAAKKNSELLEKEDDMAARRAYRNAFVSYCAANNLTPEYLRRGTTESNTRLAQARSYAVNEAAKATYHDANALATHLNQIEKMNGASKIIVGGLVPFKKTPANILKRGIEYSPISIINGIKEFRDAKGLNVDSFIAERMGEFNAAAGRDNLTQDSPYYSSAAEAAKDISKVNGVSKAELRYSAEATKTKMMADALDKLASGLTGTMIMMLGMLLGHLGLMKGAGDENDREEYYNQMLGQQEYSINAFGRNYTMDWLTPVSMPLFTGVELMKMIDEDGQLSFNEALDAVERLADPVMNLSVLQGINQSMSQYESGLGKMVLSAGESYVGQFIPTLAGQVARSIDPVRRTTYAAKEGEGLGGDLEKFRNRLENKIPFVASTNSAYVDMWGRQDVDTDPFLFRLIKNSVLPMYIKEQNKTEADDYITAIFSRTGDRSVIPNSPESSYTFDGTKVYLMSDEYQATKEMVGQISNVGVTSLMSVPGIEDLSAEEQANLVGKVYSFARAMAKADYAGAKGIADYDPDGTNTRIYNAVNAGMTIGEAVYVNYVANQFTADKNEKGNAISGSKKAKILNFYHSLGLTEDQIKAIIPSSYKYP